MYTAQEQEKIGCAGGTRQNNADLSTLELSAIVPWCFSLLCKARRQHPVVQRNVMHDARQPCWQPEPFACCNDAIGTTAMKNGLEWNYNVAFITAYSAAQPSLLYISTLITLQA